MCEMREEGGKTTIAIIGASSGQLPLVRKAKNMGLKTICFAWDRGAVCKDECDLFYPVSIYDTDQITRLCRELHIDGVATNASEETNMSASIIANNLDLNNSSPRIISLIRDKRAVRDLTVGIEGLSFPSVWNYMERDKVDFPCVVKPITGSAKQGVKFCSSIVELDECVEYAKTVSEDVMIEEYVDGDEYSVESLSFHGEHHIIQITRKVTTGHPHFVELEHHQPGILDPLLYSKVEEVVKRILTKVDFENGASHIELKVNPKGIYLIEINPRGGGDHISDTLVSLSTDCDYLAGIINIALDRYVSVPVSQKAYAGIMYLTSQNSRIQKYFNSQSYDWLVERVNPTGQLTEATTNYDRNGYIIYQSKEALNL